MHKTMINHELPLIYYGAGQAAEREIETSPNLLRGVCFIDKDENKHGKTHIGLPILSMDEATNKYGRFNLFVTVARHNKAAVFEYLIGIGIKREEIINYEETYYYGCCDLEENLIYTETKLFACCEGAEGRLRPPELYWKDNIEETILDFLALKERTVETLKKGEKTSCDGCPNLKKYVGTPENKIKLVCHGIAAPCQLSCYYCNAQERYPENKNITQLNALEFARVLKFLESENLISKDATLVLAEGEPTIHPQLDDFYEAAERYRINCSTNGVLFDKRLADLLATGRGSINVSVDSGTEETYRKVKGLDAFNKVWENITNYANTGANVSVKYIFLPENCNDNDIIGFVDNATKSGVQSIQLSRNLSDQNANEFEILYAAKMMNLARAAGINIGFAGYFSKPEADSIYKMAEELMRRDDAK